jgi:hypothetical protein
MKNEKFLVSKILVIIVVFAFSACRKSEDNTPPSQEILYSTIREVDFKNFTYPVETGKDTFTLKNGETPFGDGKDILFALENIEFADLTNDREDEAIIKMLSEYDKTSTGFMYVYTLENQKPKILWSAATGFNAQGGLKRLYSDKGDLIVELFGKNQFTESKNKFEFLGETDASKNSYRPRRFTKFRFKWNGEKFVPEGEPALLDDHLDNKINEILPGKSNV